MPVCVCWIRIKILDVKLYAQCVKLCLKKNLCFVFSSIGDIFLLVFSLDDRSSFEEVCALRKEILAAKSKLIRSTVPDHCAQPQVPLVVCANKVDLQESEREITKAEVLQALGDDCAYFETSAKESTNLEQVFETLAKRGGLPTETGPSQHRKVSLRSYQAMRSGRVAGRGKQVSDRDVPCGTLYPLARRPSFTTDLRQVIGPHTTRKPGKGLEKCYIQWETQTMRRNTERITQFIKHRYLFKNNNALLCVYMYLKCFWNKIFFNIIVCSFFLSEYGQSRRRLSQYFDYLIIVWLLHNLYSEIY